ncbi:MAG: biotin carboxylase N-terminal domain-containing protein [Eubacteriales bacterium]|nr:biotin carboxylase N-terminal domain-containing protein [Eubacteriales bacterium]
MIKKVLIANRGEIVNRVIRTCKKMNIQTVVVYSDADKDATYIADADEAYYIGPSAPVKSYLNKECIIDVIKKSGADAVHPGYGFLSESAGFAKDVADAGAIWIGPKPEFLEDIESKCFCRQIAEKAGVPITPGTTKPVGSVKEIYEIASDVGLPVLLKLDKGGGGKGIEKINSFESEEQTESIFLNMKKIGEMAFASGDVYVEKAVLNPRHIEIQFISDHTGNVVCLGERECSIQRRYQKMLEESPSPVVTEQDREKLYDYTRKLVKAMNYTGAGTIEMLRAGNGEYYFMEINARLQVEHPVSEFVTGVDIVEQQIKIAAGEPIDFKQEDICIKGHAIECRVNAEDPVTFTPMPGTISKVTFPDTTSGKVRIEHAICDGYKITPYYDSMIFKLITWGEDRNACVDNMKTALNQFEIEGVNTTIATDLKILENQSFLSGKFSTSFLKDEKFI